MNFKDLTKENIDFALNVYKNKSLSWDERMLTLMRYFEKSERTTRKYFNF